MRSAGILLLPWVNKLSLASICYEIAKCFLFVCEEQSGKWLLKSLVNDYRVQRVYLRYWSLTYILYTKINWKSVTHTQSSDKTLCTTGTGFKEYCVGEAMTFHFSLMTFYHNNSYHLLPLWTIFYLTDSEQRMVYCISLQFSGMPYFLSPTFSYHILLQD